MKRKTFFLLYLVSHPQGFCTGRLLHRWQTCPPLEFAVWGHDAAEVRSKLAAELAAVAEPRQLAPFRWSSLPKMHALRVDVHLLTQLGRTRMVGERSAPLRLKYALAEAEEGHLLLVPRFDWLLEVERPELGATLVRQQLAALLAGAHGDQVRQALPVGEESLEAFAPAGGESAAPADEEDLLAAFPETHKIAENWTSRARRGGEAPLFDLFGVEKQRPLWDRELPASLLLVGPPGVGKTSWVRLLARLLAASEDKRLLWASSAAQLMAGMSYLGQWEERCLEVVRELEYSGHYLYLGRLLPLVDKRDHSSILELFQSLGSDEGRVSLIAECSDDELERCRRLAPSALRVFRQIRLEPPGDAEMPRLVARYLERRAVPQLSSGGAATLCHLLAAYQRQSSFPGKAFVFLEKWREDLLQKARPQNEQPAKIQNSREVVDRFCQTTGLPADLVAPRQATTVGKIAAELAKAVVGQHVACAAAARVLARFRTALYDAEKPLGTLLFVGPTGVGKTELAKELARTLFGDEKRLLRFDMSEYHLSGAARRLVAVGRGVKSLAQSVRQEPLSVILFDEIEKAHYEVFDLLLGALGEGRLTDEDGGKVDLRMTIVVLTSNLGVKRGQTLGFGEDEPSAADYRKAVNKFFRPELVNRFDEIVPFQALDQTAIERIVDLQVAKIRQRPGFLKRGIKLHLEPGAKTWLAKKGFDPRYGARPLLRLLEAKVLAPLAALLAENPKTKKLQVYLTEKPVPAPTADSLVLAMEP
jgi:ATP-dependent Clp protease ATP-binding subunit ClpC